MQNILDKNKEINLKKRRATTGNSRINGILGDCTEKRHKQFEHELILRSEEQIVRENNMLLGMDLKYNLKLQSLTKVLSVLTKGFAYLLTSNQGHER